MNKVKALVLRAAGTNCDKETEFAFELAGVSADALHINELAEHPNLLRNYQILALPGGFTYGDDISAGKLLANEIKERLSDIFLEFVEADKLIIGICNGFQTLVKIGVLPGNIKTGNTEVIESEIVKQAEQSDGFTQSATLHWNDTFKFEARWVFLKVPKNSNSVFLQGIEQLSLPVAHAEGKFIVLGDYVIKKLELLERVALRYVAQDGGKAVYPYNPNGSMGDIAGISDSTGRILGIMPHPERFLFYYNHPAWTRMTERKADGLEIFVNAANYFTQ